MQLAELDVGEDQILLVGDADLAEAVVVSQVGHRVHLRVCGVARGGASGLERERDGTVAGLAVGVHAAPHQPCSPARRSALSWQRWRR